jgi:hypothetical protein
MLIRSHLFDKGFMGNGPALFDVLRNHERQILDRIKRISSLDEMTDSFLSNLIKESLIETVALDFGNMTRDLRTEDLDNSLSPLAFLMAREGRFPRQVARISIPFSGDSNLLKYTPSTHSSPHPLGQTSGRAIQFDLILWGDQDEAKRVKEDLNENLRRLRENVERVAKDVKAFNESLPSTVKAAFDVKLEELAKQHSIFDGLGIKEADPFIATDTGGGSTQKPKKGSQRASHIIQVIEKLYVHQLNQINNNAGDVNNAIQSD